MTINEMRLYISEAYPGYTWKWKVNKMPTNQVIAIYKSLINREDKKKESKKEEYHQMNIWEWAYEWNEQYGGKETHTEVKV